MTNTQTCISILRECKHGPFINGLKGEVYNWLMTQSYNIKQSFLDFTSKLLSGKKLINGDRLY